MASIDELLDAQLQSAFALNERITIDTDTRQIIIPENLRLFGVESDEKAERKYFRCSKIVGNGVDLSKLQLRINYQNAGGEKDQYIVTDVKVVDTNYIEFSWEIWRKVTKFKGEIKFIICAVTSSSNGVLANEWNTTLATGTVLEGLEVTEPTLSESESDVIAQLLQLMKTESENAVAAVKQQVELAKTQVEYARQYANQSKIDVLTVAVENTAKGTNVIVKDASTNKIPVLRVYGKSTQASAPTPAIPIQIKNIGDSLTLTNIAKSKNLLNVFDKTNVIIYGALQSDGSLKANIQNANYVILRVYHLNDLISISKGKTFTLSIKEGVSNRSIAIVIYGENTAGELITQDVSSLVDGKAGGRNVSIAISSNFTKIRYVELRFIRFVSAHTDTTSIIRDIQFEEGAVATAFTPYGMSMQNISLVEPLRGIEDARDVLTVYSDGTGQIERRCKSQILTGDENWQILSGWMFVFMNAIKAGEDNESMKGFATHGSFGSAALNTSTFYVSPDIVKNGAYIGASSIALGYPSTTEGLAAFKTFLKNENAKGTPVTIVWVKKSLTFESLTIDKISAALNTYYNETAIYNTEGAEIEVEYIADTKLYIDGYIDNKVIQFTNAITPDEIVEIVEEVEKEVT